MPKRRAGRGAGGDDAARRTHTIQVRLSADEKRTLAAAAACQASELASWVRLVATKEAGEVLARRDQQEAARRAAGGGG